MSRILDLFHDLSDEIAATETADLHSHLVWHRPQAGSLHEMVFYHFVRNELHAAGMPEDQLLLADQDARLAAALPWFPKIANTGTAYCLRRILQDLYGMKGDHLTPENLPGIVARVAETAQNPEWPREVIHRRARLRRVFVSIQLGHQRQHGFAEWRDRTPEAARYEDLFHAAGERGFGFDDDFAWLSDADSPRRAKAGWRVPDSAQEWVEGMWSYLGDAELGRMKAFLTWTSVHIRHIPGKLDALQHSAEDVWQRGVTGHPIGPEGAMILRMYAFMTMVEHARAAGVPMQVFFGSLPQGGTNGAWDATHVEYEPDTIRQFGRLADANRDVRFEFLEGAINNSQEMAIMMKMRQNVGAAGVWWHSMYPSYIRRIIAERLDVAPITKTCLFFSDAYMTEWCYGKRKLVEREFAYVLGERVAYGYLSRADASRVIYAWMRENPARTYGIPELLD